MIGTLTNKPFVFVGFIVLVTVLCSCFKLQTLQWLVQTLLCVHCALLHAMCDLFTVSGKRTQGTITALSIQILLSKLQKTQKIEELLMGGFGSNSMLKYCCQSADCENNFRKF